MPRDIMLIELQNGTRIPFDRILSLDGDRIAYLQNRDAKVIGTLSEFGRRQLEAVGKRWIEANDNAGTATLLPINQIVAIQTRFNPSDENDMRPAYVAWTSTGARFYLSGSTYDAIATQIFDVWGDLAEKPAWMA